MNTTVEAMLTEILPKASVQELSGTLWRSI